VRGGICVVWALDADVKNSTFLEFFEKEHPDRFVQCFIAEQVHLLFSLNFLFDISLLSCLLLITYLIIFSQKEYGGDFDWFGVERQDSVLFNFWLFLYEVQFRLCLVS
jgi:hypothetical protein